jgi:hypothetical protein
LPSGGFFNFEPSVLPCDTMQGLHESGSKPAGVSFIKLVADSVEWSFAFKLAASAFLAPFLTQLRKKLTAAQVSRWTVAIGRSR